MSDTLDALFPEPATPTTPDAPELVPAGEVTPVVPATPETPEVTPTAPAAFSAEAFDKWYNEKHPEAPDGIAKIEDWKTARTAKANLTRTLFTKEMELDEARKELATAKAAGLSALPETEAVKALQAELEAERTSKATELAEWQAHKAKQALEGNHAFLAEFDGTRAAIRADALAVAQEAGIDEAVVTAILGAGSRYQLAKALEAVEDPAASRLLEGMGNDFIRLTSERDAAVKSPVDHLKKWEDYNTAMQGNMTRGLQQKAVDTWAGAVPNAVKSLEAEPFFRTAAGMAELAEIEANITSGRLPNVEQSITALAKAQASDFYREAWAAGRAEVATLKAQLAKYGAADPAAAAAGVARGAPAGVSGFDPERGW
jgi:hypothetical protein